MGLFDKGKRRKGDEFDSPIEKIDLSASPSEVFGGQRTERDAEEPAATAGAPREDRPEAAAPAAPARPEPPTRDRRPPPRRSGYGIDDAIALMRTLPSENVELVVQVVKHTLESTRIEIGAIIEDAADKQGRIEDRIKILRGEISDYEGEIARRRQEIEGLEGDHRETTMVKDRLQLAERLSSRNADGAAPARAARTTGDLPRPKPATQPPPPVTVAPAAPTGGPAGSGSGPQAAAPLAGAGGAGAHAAVGSPRPTNTVIVKK